jgi:hypothetical protein
MYDAVQITHSRFLESPLNTLAASLSDSIQSISLQDVFHAYELLYYRLSVLLSHSDNSELTTATSASNAKTEESPLLSLNSLRTHASSLVLSIARDTNAVTIDQHQYSHPTRSLETQGLDFSLEVDQYKVNSAHDSKSDDFKIGFETERIELLSDVCIGALKIVGILFLSRNLISLSEGETKLSFNFTFLNLLIDNQLTLLLDSVLSILNASGLFAPRNKRITLLAMNRSCTKRTLFLCSRFRYQRCSEPVIVD